jgi:hypothetical protein
LNCATTCIASSRVGTSTSAEIPRVLCFASFSITGIRNASVFPVPVCAVAIKSFPSRACGIAAACTGVGTRNFAAFSRSFIDGLTENSEKLRSEILVILLSCRLRLPLHTHLAARGNPHCRTYFYLR